MSIDIIEPMPLVYPAQSKLQFFCRNAVAQYVLEHGAVPLHPFRLFGYFLDDRVERDAVRRANNSVVTRADEVWVFGTEISNGVLLEISLAHSIHCPIRYFTIATRAHEIEPTDPVQLTFEAELVESAAGDVGALRDVVAGRRAFASVIEPPTEARPTE